MQFGDILVCMDRAETGRERTQLVLALAVRSHARVVGYYLPPRQKGGEGEVENLDDAAADFARQLTMHSLEGTWIVAGASHREEEIATLARYVDLVVVGLGDPDDPASDPERLDTEQLVIGCGRPVLGIPIANVPERIGENILVAWDGSREAARALHDAIPFLRDAATIKIASIESKRTSVGGPSAVVAHLQRLGISATVDTMTDLGLPIEDEIFTRVDWEHVDLLVAGAFGHSRVRERVLGGVSRSLLHQMMVPVLVSH